jgi:hypothetical protein
MNYFVSFAGQPVKGAAIFGNSSIETTEALNTLEKIRAMELLLKPQIEKLYSLEFASFAIMGYYPLA